MTGRRTSNAVQGFERRATMADIAKRAGVSQATVSLVMNGAGKVRISAATRSRVLEVADELGYRIGRRAIGSGAVRSIGMLIDEVSTGPFAAAAMVGARELAWQNGCVLTVVTTRGEPALEESALDLILAQPTVGVIYASMATRQVAPPDRLRTVPTVLLNCRSSGDLYPAVVPGNLVGARAATEALLKAGHRRIAFINGEGWMEAARDRLRGFRQAHSDRDVAVDADLIRPGRWLLDAAYEQTLALMGLRTPPTAIFCASDRMALGCYAALREVGRSIPSDVSVVGFDDETLAGQISPALTTVLVPHEAMGRWAVEQLLSFQATAIRGARPKPVKFECPLVERSSVAPVGGRRPAPTAAPRSSERRAMNARAER